MNILKSSEIFIDLLFEINLNKVIIKNIKIKADNKFFLPIKILVRILETLNSDPQKIKVYFYFCIYYLKVNKI